MDERLKPTYDLYKEKISNLESDLARMNDELKRAKHVVNQLLIDSGEPIEFEEITSDWLDAATAPSSQASRPPTPAPKNMNIRVAQFFSRPLAKAVKEILVLKGEAMSFPEILGALRQGSFDVPKGKLAERKLRGTILKNTTNFVLIGDNHFGLKSWYPNRKIEKKRKRGSSGTAIPEKTQTGGKRRRAKKADELVKPLESESK